MVAASVRGLDQCPEHNLIRFVRVTGSVQVDNCQQMCGANLSCPATNRLGLLLCHRCAKTRVPCFDP